MIVEAPRDSFIILSKSVPHFLFAAIREHEMHKMYYWIHLLHNPLMVHVIKSEILIANNNCSYLMTNEGKIADNHIPLGSESAHYSLLEQFVFLFIVLPKVFLCVWYVIGFSLWQIKNGYFNARAKLFTSDSLIKIYDFSM